MKENFIPVNEPLLDGNEKKYLNECIETGWISSEGPFVKRFEKKLSERVDRKYGIAVCNGSAALDIAVKALGIGEGDEVILPTFTIISCAAAIVRARAIPVVVDCDPLTWNMNIAQIEDKITKRTKAIMVVHIYGLPVEMDKVLSIAEKYGLMIIEDAAEMHGQTYMGKPCGSFGDISTFSFYPNKLVTAGEGGMIVTNDEKLAEHCRSLRNLCFLPQKRFLHEDIGWNYRISNIQAAVGLAQLERLDEFISRKRKIGTMYTELLSGVKELQLPIKKTNYAENIYWVFAIVLNDEININAEEIMELLKERRIGTRPFFYPMHKQPVFKKMGLFKNEKYPISERIAKQGFYIPCGLALKDDQIYVVADVLKSIIANCSNLKK